MNRAEVARLLTKVMGGETEALSNPIVVLDYAMTRISRRLPSLMFFTYPIKA
jgi:hypothetical protein